MRLLGQGWSQAEVARKLKVTPAAVSQWVKAHREGGADALRARPHPGAKPRLDDRQLQRLETLLEKGPRTRGAATDRWTLRRVAELIEDRFGVAYDPSGVWHLLHRMGWRFRRPRGRGREDQGNARAQWRKADRPGVRRDRRRRREDQRRRPRRGHT